MRSHYCGLVDEKLIDETVTLCGWVDRRRDHGGVIFLDMRDREGVVQVVFDPDTEEHFQKADSVRSEFVLCITGRVRARTEATINPSMASGRIEVLGKTLQILNSAQTPPLFCTMFFVPLNIAIVYTCVCVCVCIDTFLSLIHI